MANLLYGAGLRLQECLQLRVKDIDFSYNQITIRAAKGDKDRITVLPQNVKEPLRQHLLRVKKLHESDLRKGSGMVYMPAALERKYPKAAYEWGWQYVFPADTISVDPRSGIRRRHHIGNWVIQRAIQRGSTKIWNNQAGQLPHVQTFLCNPPA